MEDKILFEQAYSSHGKSFKRIQQTVSKTMSCSVWENCNECSKTDKSVEIMWRVKLWVPLKYTYSKALLHSWNLRCVLKKMWTLRGVCNALCHHSSICQKFQKWCSCNFLAVVQKNVQMLLFIGVHAPTAVAVPTAL